MLLSLFLVYSDVLYSDTNNSVDKNEMNLAEKDFSSTITDGKSLILNSEIFGIDGKGQPFSMKAQKTGYDREKISMKNIYLKIFLFDKKETIIYADQGIYSINKKQIDLQKNVKITMSDGDLIEAYSINIEYDKGIITSNHPVSAVSKNDKISANGFKIIYSAKEKNITFYGDAKVDFSIN